MQFKMLFSKKILVSTTILGLGAGGYYTYKYFNPYFRKSIFSDDSSNSGASQRALENHSAILAKQDKEFVSDKSMFLSKETQDDLSINSSVIDIKQRYHATDFIHGLLSSHSYLNSDEGDTVTFQNPLKTKYNQYLEGWRVHTVFKPQDADDYYSVLYVNNQEKQAVLAHRGTDIPNSLKLQNDSLKADLIEILNRNIGKQQEQSYIATKESLDIVQSEDYHFSTTGHSLGAWLAELSIYFLHAEFDYRDAKAITFDSPGTKDHLETYKRNVDNRETRINQDELDITTYLSAPNIVNTCNGHIGKVYRLFPKIDLPEFFKQELSSAIPKFITDRKHYVDALSAVSGHMLDPMLECFNPETGRSIITGSVLDWPHIKHDCNTTIADRVTSASNSVLMRTGLFIGKYVVNKLVPENTINSLSNVIVSFLAGDTELTQLFKTYRYLDIATNEAGIELKKDLSLSDNFSLSFVGNYKIKEVDLNTSMKIIDNTPEWKLKQIYRWDEQSMRKQFCEDTTEKLLILRREYKLESDGENGKKIKTINQDLFIDDLVDQFKLILDSDKELKNYKGWSDLKYLSSKAIEYKIESDLIKTIDNFIPKQNLFEDIDRVLSTKSYVAITGVPGIGKSTYSYEYASAKKQQDKQTLIIEFLSASEDNILSKCKDIIKNNNLQINDQDKARKIIENVFKKISSQVGDSGAILIFDNVTNYSEIKPYLEKLPDNIKIIITSWDSLDKNSSVLKKDSHIEVEPFTKIESIDYLESKIKNIYRLEIPKAQEEAFKLKLEELVDEVSSKGAVMPYRLEMVFSGIYEQCGNLSNRIDQYIELYKNGGDDKPETKLLLDILSKSELSWHILQYALYLDPDSMDKEIFAKLLDVNSNELNKSIDNLTQKSLIKENITFNSEELAIHQLTQKEIKKYIKRHASDINIPSLPKEEIIINLVNVIHELMPEMNNNPCDNLSRANSFYKHANKIIKKIKNSDIKLAPTKIIELYRKLGLYDKYITHNYKKELEYYKAAKEICESLEENAVEREISLSLDMDIGWCYFRFRDLDASEEYFNEVLKYFQVGDIAKDLDNINEIISSNRLTQNELSILADAYTGIAFVYDQRHTQPEYALSLHESALTIYEFLAKTENDQKEVTAKEATAKEATALHNIGWYYRNHHDPQEALRYFTKSHDMRKELYKNNDNADHKDIADSLNSIGTSYVHLSETEDKEENLLKGLDYQLQALEMRKRLFKSIETSDNVASYSRLGETYRAMGDNDRIEAQNLSAIDCYGMAIKYFEKMLSASYELYNNCTHNHIIGSFQRLAEIAERLNNKVEATEYYKKSYSILMAKNCQFTHDGDIAIKNKIEEYVPGFKDNSDVRICITNRGKFDVDVYKIKMQLQEKNILDKIYKLSSKGIWQSDALNDKGVVDYVSDQNLIKALGLDVNADTDIDIEDYNHLKTAKSICFEAINFGIMSARKDSRDIKCLTYFAQANPEIIKIVKENHPEYFIDGSLLIESFRYGFIDENDLQRSIDNDYINAELLREKDILKYTINPDPENREEIVETSGIKDEEGGSTLNSALTISDDTNDHHVDEALPLGEQSESNAGQDWGCSIM